MRRRCEGGTDCPPSGSPSPRTKEYCNTRETECAILKSAIMIVFFGSIKVQESDTSGAHIFRDLKVEEGDSN